LALFRGFGFVPGWLCRSSKSACLCLAKVLAKIKVHPFSAGILVSVKFPRCGSQFCSVFLFGASPVFSRRFGQHKVFGFWSKEKMRVKSGQVCGGSGFYPAFWSAGRLPNKACTRRWGFGGIFKIFLRLSIFPIGRRSAARPSAGNANRWAVHIQYKRR
jgi:hypothetical protein